jgi:hypothetical protein
MHHARIPVLILATVLGAAAGCSRSPIRGSRTTKDANWKATVQLCELHENYPGSGKDAPTIPKALVVRVTITYTGPDADVELPTMAVDFETGGSLKPKFAHIHGGIDGAAVLAIISGDPQRTFLQTGAIAEPGKNCTYVYSLPPAAKEGRLRIGKLPPIQLRL